MHFNKPKDIMSFCLKEMCIVANAGFDLFQDCINELVNANFELCMYVTTT